MLPNEKAQSLIQFNPCLLLRVRYISTRKRVGSSPLHPELRRLFCFHGDLQRCDAKRPCTPCVESGMSEECVYGRDPVLQRVAQKSKPTDTLRSPHSHKSELSPSSSSQWTSKDLSPSNQSLPPSDTSSSTSSYPNSTLSRVSPREPNTPREGSMSGVVLFRKAVPKPRSRTLVVLPSISIHPFVWLPSIPRGLQLPLSFIDPEVLRISDATSSELNLSLYVFSPGCHATHCVC
jgi:hypothetical protein